MINKMTPRENLISLYHRKGYQSVPLGFILCPDLENEFIRRYPDAVSYQDHFRFPYRIIVDPGFAWNFDNLDMIPDRNSINWYKYYPDGFTYDVKFDGWGVAHEDNPNSMHMTQMHHPLKNIESLQEFQTYPWPDYTKVDFSSIEKQIKDTDLALAEHLSKAITFGNTPRYIPEDGLTWETRPVKND